RIADRTGLTAFAAELLQYCKNPDIEWKTGLFEQLGLTVSEPVITGTGDYILSSAEVNAYSVTQSIVDSDGDIAYVYGVKGYVIREGQSVTEGLTFSYDGYLNGIYCNGKRARGNCAAGDGFSIIVDSDGKALRVVPGSVFEYAK
ncbi:MAG: hypothetical protein J6330_09570, partial [Clostridia bacterium]|nr:hypothetical protein [Clostridia bacterium]